MLRLFIVVLKKLHLKVASILLCLFSLAGIFYLGARASALILLFNFISLTVAGQGRVKERQLRSAATFLICLVILVFAFISFASDQSLLLLTESLRADLFLQRLSEEGFDSSRWDMISIGLSSIARYPEGGFSPPDATYEGPWFHNIFIDNARLGGDLALLLTLLLYIFPVLFWFSRMLIRSQRAGKDQSCVSLMLMVFLSCAAWLFQDVAFEGPLNIVILLFLSGSSLIVSCPRSSLVSSR